MTSTGGNVVEPGADEKIANGRPRATIRVGSLALVGPPAVAVLVLLLAAIVGLLGYFRPRPSPLWLSGALWIAFFAYWGAAAANTAATKDSESRESRRVHERLMNAALLLLFLPIPGLTLRFVPSSPITILAGFGVHIASFLLAIWARRHLGKYWSGAITIKVDHQLIRSGPYAIARHPIYTAMLGMFVGTALVSGQLHALLGVVTIAAAYWRKIRMEEVRLRENFGEAYASYQKETAGLIPWIL